MVTWCTYSMYDPQTLSHWKFAVHIHCKLPLTSIFQLYIHGIHHATMIHIYYTSIQMQMVPHSSFESLRGKFNLRKLRLVISYVACYCRLITKNQPQYKYVPQLHFCWYMRPWVDMFVNQPHYHALCNTNLHTPLVTRSNYTKVLTQRKIWQTEETHIEKDGPKEHSTHTYTAW